MLEEHSYLSQPRASERLIVEEMLHNRESKYWNKYNEFVVQQVHFKAKNLSWSSQEEVIQEAMYKIARFLPNFRFECSLRSWMYTIIESCIADEYRHIRREERFHVSLVDTFTEGDHEVEELKRIAANSISIEEAFEISEKMRNWEAALLKYVSTHANPMRNLQIVRMVILEGHTQTETARAIGCDTGVVSYVVREAKSYAKKMEHKP